MRTLVLQTPQDDVKLGRSGINAQIEAKD
jgi:hypothetical protein